MVKDWRALCFCWVKGLLPSTFLPLMVAAQSRFSASTIAFEDFPSQNPPKPTPYLINEVCLMMSRDSEFVREKVSGSPNSRFAFWRRSCSGASPSPAFILLFRCEWFPKTTTRWL